MNFKKALAIGLLATAIAGLTAGAIFLAKKNKLFKPKVLQTSAYYEYTQLNGNKDNPNWTITGEPQNYNVSFWQKGGAPAMPKFNYGITKSGPTINYSITFHSIYWLNTDETPNLIEEAYPIGGNTIETRTINNITKQIDEIKIVLCKLDPMGWNNATEPNQIATQMRLDIYFIDGTIQNSYITHYITTATNVWVDDFRDENIYVETIQTSIPKLLTYGNNQYQAGASTATQAQEVIDVRGMMYSILSMPFTFISQGFNVTLWEGTQYAINIGNFIKGIIAIASILFIIKLFTTGFAIIGNYTITTTEKLNTKKQKIKAKYEKGAEKNARKIERKMNDGFRRG